jgi:VWFA-related protein
MSDGEQVRDSYVCFLNETIDNLTGFEYHTIVNKRHTLPRNSLMKKAFFFACITAFAALTLYPQQPVSTPTPAGDGQVVKINTDLIQIDVTVTDKDGKVVTTLRPEDFELFENGEKQTITNFGFVSKTIGGATTAGGGNIAPPANGQTSVPIKRSDVRRTMAIVIDDLNLSFASVFYTRKAINRFIDEQMRPDDLVAIIRVGGGVGALQQFTSDKRVLKAAVAAIKWNPLSSLDALSSISQNDTEISERFRVESDQVASGNPKQYTLLHPHDNVDEVQQASKQASKNSAAMAQAIYSQTALGTLKYIISGMKTLPGRKAMFLFSDGIDIKGEMNNKSRAGTVFDFMQDVTDVANRSSVNVYTFDTRGMASMMINAYDNTYEVIDGHREQKMTERKREFDDKQDGLAYLANQTGGKALLNSDDLNGGIQRALEEQSGFYLLGYVPDADTFDAKKRKFNKFEVRVKPPGLKVSYRSGFFSSDNSIDQPATVNADKQIADSLMSPFTESDIAININALYANDPRDGAYIRSFLHIDARDLKFDDTTDGWKKATFDVAAVTFGMNGVPSDFIQTSYTIKAKGPTLDTILNNGFVYVLMLPVKKAGIYQYRVALRDAGTGKLGTASQTLEIPDLTRQQLTLSSLAVENVSANAWQLINQGKVGGGTDSAQLKSTLLYDTVLRQFRPASVLRYGFEVYNAKPDPSKNVHLETVANIVQNGKVIIEGSPTKFDSTDDATAAGPRISGAVMLSDKLPAGDYALEITLRDTVSKQERKQRFAFQIN